MRASSALTVPWDSFYSEYHGHDVHELKQVEAGVRKGRGVLWLMGDSTLDNKHWIRSSTVEACNGYEKVLRPPRARPDVAYWVNKELERRSVGDHLCCINGAIEESTLGLRSGTSLLPQDAFVQQHVTEDDVIVVCCGGNDIALRPTVWTILWMVALLACPKALISTGLAPGLGHFINLFRDGTRNFVENVTRNRKPRAVVVCMLYYLDERPGGSWADAVLQKLGYNTDPDKLQLVMRQVYDRLASSIKIDGVETVVPVALYEALDGKDTNDYIQRVEPSSQGGEKIAKLILDKLLPRLQVGNTLPMDFVAEPPTSHRRAASPVSSVIRSMPDSVHNKSADIL